MITEVLSLALLRAMTADEAAPLWMMRGTDTSVDAQLFEQWLTDRDANAAAWAKAHRIWDSFDHAGDDEMLQVMRASALAARPRRQRLNWGWMAAGVAIAVMAGGLHLAVLARPTYEGTRAEAYNSGAVQPGLPTFSTDKDQQLQAGSMT